MVGRGRACGYRYSGRGVLRGVNSGITLSCGAWWWCCCCCLRLRVAETIAEVDADGAIAEDAAWRCFPASDSWHHIAEGGLKAARCLERWVEVRLDQGVREESKHILVRGADRRLDVVSSFQYLGYRPITEAGSIWIFTRQELGDSTNGGGGGGVVNERSILKLVWFKLRWLGVSDEIDLQIDRLQQWKS